MIERESKAEEKGGVYSLIRFRALKVSIVTESVGGRRPESHNLALPSLSLSFHFTFSSFRLPSILFIQPEAKEPNSIINSEFFSLKSDPGTRSTCHLSNMKAQRVSGD